MSSKTDLAMKKAERRGSMWSSGMEQLAYHARFSAATDISVYFCDPQSPWQRGSNENTNGLLRQYFPKGTDLSSFSQDDLDQVALKLNTRPWKTLGYATPSDRLDAALALTGWTHPPKLQEIIVMTRTGSLLRAFFVEIGMFGGVSIGIWRELYWTRIWRRCNVVIFSAKF
jgi:hypothetical protein